MKKLLFAALYLALFPSLLSAQYEKILNDPDVIWATEITLDFVIEPEYTGAKADSLNTSTPIKFLNSASGQIVPEQVMFAPKLLELAKNGTWPAYLDPKDAAPISPAERLARIGNTDTITVQDIETSLMKNVVVHNDIDPIYVQEVRVRQLLYYREKTAEFEVFTLAFAPIIRRMLPHAEPEVFLYSYVPFWFKMPPEKRNKTDYPNLNSPHITWARRLKTVGNDIRLDSLRPLKDFKQPVVQQLLNRMRDDAHYTVVSSDWQPMTMADRQFAVFEVDSVLTFDPETYEEKIEVVKKETTGGELKQLRLMEDWLWDDKRKSLTIRLHAFAPMKTIIDNEGNPRGTLPFFWREKQRKK